MFRRIKYLWLDEYMNPHYWNNRTPQWGGMPKPVNLYLNLNDNKLRKFFSTFKGKTLDGRCGTGRFLNYADVGVDFSAGMLKRAKQVGRSLVRADLLYLPFRDKAFENSFMVDVSIHVKSKELLFAELQRVANNFYNYIGKDRTVYPYIYTFLTEHIRLKPRRLYGYIALTFTFFLDRIRSNFRKQRRGDDIDEMLEMRGATC